MKKLDELYRSIITEDTCAMRTLRNQSLSKVKHAQQVYQFLKDLHDSLLADTIARYFIKKELKDINDPRIETLKQLYNSSYVDRRQFDNNSLPIDQFINRLQQNTESQRSNRGRRANYGEGETFDNGVTIYKIQGENTKEINAKTMQVIKKYWGSVISPKQLYPSYLPNKLAFQKGYLIGVQNTSKKTMSDNCWLDKRGRRHPYVILLNGEKFYPYWNEDEGEVTEEAVEDFNYQEQLERFQQQIGNWEPLDGWQWSDEGLDENQNEFEETFLSYNGQVQVYLKEDGSIDVIDPDKNHKLFKRGDYRGAKKYITSIFKILNQADRMRWS